MEVEGDFFGGAEGDAGGEVEGFGGVGEVEVEAGGEGGEGEHHFEPGEGFADAVAGAGGEGEVGVAGVGGIFPAFGAEVEGIGEVAGVAVEGPLDDDEGGFFGDAVAAEFELLLVFASEGPGGGPEAHGFGDDPAGAFEVGEVGGGGQAVAEDAVEFFVEKLLFVGIAGEEPEGEGHGVGGGFVAGGEDGDGLVAQLLVGKHG